MDQALGMKCQVRQGCLLNREDKIGDEMMKRGLLLLKLLGNEIWWLFAGKHKTNSSNFQRDHLKDTQQLCSSIECAKDRRLD